MSGLKIVLPYDFTYGVKTFVDERLNTGSILLLESAKDGGSAVPTSLINHASSEFLANSGLSVDSVTLVDTLTGQAGALIQKTTKGAINVNVPANLAVNASRYRFAAVLPQEILDYCVANKSHNFYFAMCGVITRNLEQTGLIGVTLAGINAAPDGALTTDTTQTVSICQRQSSKNVQGAPFSATNIIGETASQAPSPVFLADTARDGFTFPVPPTTSNSRGEIFTFGAKSGTNTVLTQNQPSGVIYWIYFEDMTISGRTYEQCHDAQQAYFNKRFGSGGLYSDDSWTAPTL